MQTTIDWPSRGLLYPNKEILVRTLLGRDEKAMAEITMSQFDKKFALVMKDTVSGVDTLDLTLGDRSYLMLWQAVNSYTHQYPVKLACGNCGKALMVTVDLSKIEVTKLPEDFKEPYTFTGADGLPIQIRVLRVRDEIEAEDYETKNPPHWLYRWAQSMIVENKTTLEKVAMLESMPARDVAKIRAFHEKFFHGPRMMSEYQCMHCQHKGTMQVPLGIELFFPAWQELE